ncbi:MAG: hypothetical protein GY909_14940 [Oligoflexia bacterium]|nr:hypothetical protein [Oligoflexia bacterium]
MRRVIGAVMRVFETIKKLNNTKYSYVYIYLFFFGVLSLIPFKSPFYPNINGHILNHLFALILAIYCDVFLKKITNTQAFENINDDIEYGVLLKTISLLFLATPANSFLHTIGLPIYFPNDKLTAVVCGIVILYREKNNILTLLNSYKVFLIPSIFLLGLIVSRDLLTSSFIKADYNLIFVLFSVFLYKRIFTSGSKESTFKAFKFVLIFQLVLSTIQFALYLFGETGQNMFFHNHPMQENYNFFYRVSGGFLESSQFASFLVLGIVLLIKENWRKNWQLLAWSFVMMCISFSTTAFILLITYSILNYKLGFIVVLIAAFVVFLLSQVSEEVFRYAREFVTKVTYSLNISPDNVDYPRAKLTFIKLNDLFLDDKRLLFGSPLSKELPGGDIISYYAHSLGIIGSSLYYFVFYKLLEKTSLFFVISIAMLCMTNAPLTNTILQIYIIIGMYILKFYKRDLFFK